ncbi:MAG: zinc-ribbon domain-containing protein [Rudaea sp.]
MITCPNCGQPVPENQRFCGNCGTDLSAVHAFQEQPGTAAPNVPPSPDYAYDTGQYNYAPPPDRRPSLLVVLLALAAVAVVCLCCGMVLGAAGLFYLNPAPTPIPALSPVPAPTPEGLLHFLLQI